MQEITVPPNRHEISCIPEPNKLVVLIGRLTTKEIIDQLKKLVIKNTKGIRTKRVAVMLANKYGIANPIVKPKINLRAPNPNTERKGGFSFLIN